jgi:uncharacterized BrkB/YihY/UPF0761 family membrane protein
MENAYERKRGWRELWRDLRVLGRSHLLSYLDLGSSGALSHAAAISYYTILSIFPFLMLLVVVSTRLLSDPNLSIQAIRLLGSYIPNGRQFLAETLPVLQRISGTMGVVSVGGLAWSSMGLFAALRAGLDQVSGDRTPPSSLLQHWTSFIAVLATSLGLLVGLGLSTLLSFVGRMSFQFLEAIIVHLGPLSGDASVWFLRPAGLALQAGTLAFSSMITWTGILFLLNHLPRVKPGWGNTLIPALWVTIGLDQLNFHWVYAAAAIQRPDT